MPVPLHYKNLTMCDCEPFQDCKECAKGEEVKKKVISLRCHRPMIEAIGGGTVELPLPKGCLGVAWIFESKKSAKDFLGKKADRLHVIELQENT